MLERYNSFTGGKSELILEKDFYYIKLINFYSAHEITWYSLIF